ncbi:hypothetical protein DOY81_004076 [Sarcophaga bullata]|nr:hypothetical protein DOY81_004076 [Sarcophaga bullata]
MASSTPGEFVATLKEDSEQVEDNQHQVATLQENIEHVEGKSTSTEYAGKRLIFTPPFFKIVHEPADSTRVTVRCYSCGVLRKCSYHSYAHLKTHLKRLHPKLHTLFEKHRWKVGWSTRRNYSDSAKKQAVLELENELKLINQRQVATVKRNVKHTEDKSKSAEFARKRLILNSPFFKIVHGSTNNTNFKVRCCSCRVVKKCGYNSTVHLSRHLKHFHPNLHTLYEKHRRQGVVDFAEKDTVLVEIKSEVIERDQKNPVENSQLKMSHNDLKGIVSNFNTADIATTSKNANYFNPLDTDEVLNEPHNEAQSKEKHKTSTKDLGILIFKSPFFEILQKKKLTVRCYTCGLVQNDCDINTEHLTQHIQSLHPHVLKKYEEHRCTDDDACVDSMSSFNNEITEKPVPKSDKGSEMEEIDENDTPSSSRKTKQPIQHQRTIFKKPFFDIIRVFDEDKNRLLVSCHTCHVVKKARRYNASHLSDHIKRLHPLIYKLYEEQKRHTNDRNQPLKNKQNIENTKELNARESRVTNREKSDISLKNLEVIIDRTLRKLVNHTGYYAIRHRLTILNEDTVQKKYSSDMLKLQSDIENLKEECKALRVDVKKTNVNKIKLQNEIQRLDSLLNQRKLIIINMEITNRRQPWIDVQNLFKTKLNLNEIKIVGCTVSPTEHRTSATITTIELLRPEDCGLVLSQVDKLKNTGITIEPELSPLLREQRNKLMILRKELLSRKPELNVIVRYATLLVEGKKFYWDRFDGLCHDFTCTETNEIDSVEYMNQLTGLDVSEFIYVLRQYHIRGY